MLLDSDDFFKKNKVKMIIEYFTKNPKSNIVFDLPIYYYSKNKQIYSQYRKDVRKDMWPRFPIAGSCISFRREFYKKFSRIINSKNFSMLTLDFRLSAIANVILRDFKLINKNLTFYFQDIHGESYSKFKRFNRNWWLRRKQAHDFIKKIKKDNLFSLKTKIDYYITNAYVKIFNISS